MKLKKTVKDLINNLDDDQYIAVGSGLPERKKGTPQGSGFYFIGKVRRYKKDIEGINAFHRKSSDNPDAYIPLEDRIITDIRNRHIPGEPPMYAVLAEGTEAGRCWVLSEYDKTFKSEPAKIKDMTGFHHLRMAITMRTVNDYEERIKGKASTADLDSFLESSWGEMITGADGKKIEDVCRLRAHYSMWRDAHKCNKCKRQKCVHISGEHFTTMEKGRLVCLKEEDGDEDND